MRMRRALLVSNLGCRSTVVIVPLPSEVLFTVRNVLGQEKKTSTFVSIIEFV